jgi:hypothetical protein
MIAASTVPRRKSTQRHRAQTSPKPDNWTNISTMYAVE